MNYPLGSFPRFAHQENWAAERRARAIHNSAVTRQNAARRHLEAERKVGCLLDEIVSGLIAQNSEGEQIIAGLRRRIDRIKLNHEQGKRVYYGYLGETLLQISMHITDFQGVQNFSKQELETLVMILGGLRSPAEEAHDLARQIEKIIPR